MKGCSVYRLTRDFLCKQIRGHEGWWNNLGRVERLSGTTEAVIVLKRYCLWRCLHLYPCVRDYGRCSWLFPLSPVGLTHDVLVLQVRIRYVC